MNNPHLFKTPATITKKINRLHHLLVKEKELFEQVSGQVTDHALRCSILSVAQQNNQYAVELSAHMQTTNSIKTINVLAEKKYHAAPSKDIFAVESGVLRFCSSNERKIVIAYRKILQDAGLYEGLQKMMRYQLNGIVFACTQLKLLNSVNHVRKSKRLVAHC